MSETTLPPAYPEDGSFDWYWYAGNVFFGTGVFIGTIITCIHTKNVCIDMFTQERSCIPRQKKPKKSTTYKLTSWCLLLSLYCFLYNMIWSGISNVITTKDHELFCYVMTLNATNSYQLAKMLMYLIFIVRLYAVYNTTAYRYPPKVLLTICILIVVVSLVLMTLITINATTINEVHQNEAKDHIVSCSGEWPLPVLGMIVLFDLVLSIFSMSAFIHPLRKVMKAMAHNKKLNDLMRIGQKYAILTSCACITTIWLMAMAGIGYLAAAPVDLLTNMICLMLTTAYYPDGPFYKRICCLPIKCSNICCKCCCGSHGAYSETPKMMELEVVDSKTGGSNQTQTPQTPNANSNSPDHLPSPTAASMEIETSATPTAVKVETETTQVSVEPTPLTPTASQ